MGRRLTDLGAEEPLLQPRGKTGDGMLSACHSCTYWSKWLANTGDCLFPFLHWRDELLEEREYPRPGPAMATDKDHWCDQWKEDENDR